MDIRGLIDCVRESPELWDHRDPSYHNCDSKSKKWKEISEKLQVQGDQAKQVWEDLRDSFQRELKKIINNKTGQSADPSFVEWPYFKQMMFIKDIIPLRPTISNIRKDLAHLQLEDSSQSTSGTSISYESLPNNRFKRKSNDETLDIDKKKLHLFEDKLQSGQTQEDEDYKFLMSILPSLRKVRDERKMGLRMEIRSIIYKQLGNGLYEPE